MTKETEKHNELLALYQQTSKEISRYRSLPWRLNIVQAVLTAILVMVIINLRCSHFISENFIIVVFICIISSLLITFFSCYTAGYCFDKVADQRKVLNKIYNKFGDDFNEAINNCDPTKLDFGDVIALIANVIFPIISMSILILVCIL